MHAEAGMTNAIYEAAERLVRLGVSVIPIQPGTKEPPVGFRWGVYARRIADASERYEWFVERRYQMAVVSGPVSGWLVPLDFDGEGGYEALAARQPRVRELPRLRTGSGKRHVWLRVPRPIRKYTTRAPDGTRLEVRAGTHYTLVPPSIHPSGSPYVWEQPPWDGIPVIDLAEIGLPMMDPRDDAEPGEPIEEGEPLSERDRGLIVELLTPHYVPSARHELCLATAGWLAGHGVPESDARQIVRALAEQAGDTDRLKEFLRGVRDTYRRAREGYAVAGWARLTDREDPLVSPATAKQLDLLLRGRNLIIIDHEHDPQHPWIISVTDLLKEPEEPDLWIVEGLVRHPTVSLVVGPAKTFKSLLVQEMAVSVASGLPMFGLFSVPEARTVIYVQEESSRRAVRRRFRHILAGHDLHPGAVAETLYTVTNQGFEFDNPSTIQRLVADGIEAYEPDLVIFDPLAEMHGADENSSREMRPILKVMKQLRDTYGVSIVVVHHNNKSNQYTNPADMIRGTTAIWGAMDGGIFVMETERDNEKQVRVTLKEGGQVAPFIYRPQFEETRLQFTVCELEGQRRRTLTDEEIIAALRRLGGWWGAAELGSELGFSVKTIQARLNALVARGGIVRRVGRAGKFHYAVPGTSDDAPDF